MTIKSVRGPSVGRVRLSINGGPAITDDVIRELAVQYKIKSPALVKADRIHSKRQSAPGHERYTRALLFAELVNRAAENQSLCRQLHAFYVEHIEFFSSFQSRGAKTRGTKKQGAEARGAKTFSVDEDFVSYCTALAFKITGDGGISKLYRVLLHFFAVKHGILPEPPKSKETVLPIRHTTKAKPRLTLRPDPIVDRRVGHDDENDEVNLDDKLVQLPLAMDAVRSDEIAMLSQVFELKRSPLLRSLIESAFDDHKEAIVAYAKTKYKPAPAGSKRTLINFRPTKVQVDLIKNLSFAMFGNVNKSLTMSVIISFFAKKAVRKPVGEN